MSEQHTMNALIGNTSTAVEDLREGHLIVWDGQVYRVERNVWNRAATWHEVTLTNTDGTLEVFWGANEHRTTIYAVSPPFSPFTEERDTP